MSYAVHFAPTAQEQLDAIETWIALASGHATLAAHFVDGIVTFCESLQTFPERGTRRDDLLPGLRITNYRKHTVVAFQVETRTQRVSIVGIFYGGQDYESALSDG